MGRTGPGRDRGAATAVVPLLLESMRGHPQPVAKQSTGREASNKMRAAVCVSSKVAGGWPGLQPPAARSAARHC